MAKAKQAEEKAESVPILSRLRPPAGAIHGRRRRGRGPGSGLGTTGGKGQKGQKSRHPINFGKLGFEGGQVPLQRRLPKLGFHNPFSKRVEHINVRDLAQFDAKSTVGIEDLRTKGLIRKRFDAVKVLGDGELDRPLTVRVHAFSKAAREKIEKAGGKAEVLTPEATADTQ